jgi:hypothetical protein
MRSWLSLRAVDTIKIWMKAKLPRPVFKQLAAFGAYYPPEDKQPRFGRVLYIHDLAPEALAVVERFVDEYKLVISRVDIRFDVSFARTSAIDDPTTRLEMRFYKMRTNSGVTP